jgi:hypothetical protein
VSEERRDIFNSLLVEVPILFVATLWTILAVITNQSYIGLIGLAILYRRYAKKNKVDENEK